MESSNLGDCENIRQTIEGEDHVAPALTDAQQAQIEQHLVKCPDCQSWSEQTNQINKLSKELPQFDVPESLTQNILKAVASENRYHSPVSEYLVWAIALILTGLLAIYLADTIESLDGIISWLAGFGILLLLRLLIKDERSKEAVHQ